MSTLNAYFTARKSRKTSINKEKTLAITDGESKKQYAVQVPQPVYEKLPKQKAITSIGTRNTVDTKKHPQDKSRNSILHYLSPAKNPTHTNEESTSLCQIRRNIPVTHVWNLILEEFDPQSHPNQLDGSPSPSPTTEKTELSILSEILSSNNRRRKLEQDTHVEHRCARIRTSGPSSSSVEILCSEDYLLEDNNEDLARPLRNKHTVSESRDFYTQMLENLGYT